jgi:phenylalanyl-tRNA synthetase alpha chain
MSWLKDASKEDKPKLGQGLNALKKELEAAFEDKKSSLGGAKPQAAGPAIDVTEPGIPPKLGRVHVLQQVVDELIEVFARMGFDHAEGPELEDEQHNFVDLNIPAQHPARDPLDNFYIDNDHLLRTQTSTVQVRVMENIAPPIRVCSVGRVYRPDTHDATHTSMFHQVEGLYVDRNVSMVDLKTTLIQFARRCSATKPEIRLRPSYFPFTEPSAELDIKMQVKGVYDWVELGGCGWSTRTYSRPWVTTPSSGPASRLASAWKRIAMRRWGIEDIRWFFENDIRFLRQF